MSLDQTIRKFLQSHKDKSISLDQLEKLCSGQTSYTDFAHLIHQLLKEEVLTPFKNGKPTIKDPTLHYKYRFHKPLLNQSSSEEIQAAQRAYHTINLSKYYHLSQDLWISDRPYVEQIHYYLLEHKTLPKEHVVGTELSFALVGDEKWIDEGGGKAILERLDLWDKLDIQKHPDPLMMAIDTSKTNQKPQTYCHLVVENKSTYYALLKELPNTIFTSLIYGQGWKITANIKELENQLPGLQGRHEIYYFGDLDYEGITIWHKLNQVRPVHIARPFYKALLKEKESDGSKNQQRKEEAMAQFLANFKEEKERINNLLTKGHYYPQEAIKENQLREIFKSYRQDQGQEE